MILCPRCGDSVEVADLEGHACPPKAEEQGFPDERGGKGYERVMAEIERARKADGAPGVQTGVARQVEPVKRFCQKCVEEEAKSTLRETNCHSDFDDLGTFWDEEGYPHSHAKHRIVRRFRCSLGHETAEGEKWQGSCWCGWKADA